MFFGNFVLCKAAVPLSITGISLKLLGRKLQIDFFRSSSKPVQSFQIFLKVFNSFLSQTRCQVRAE